jgi:hypothetical protein
LPSPKEDRFAIDAGWSKTGVYPSTSTFLQREINADKERFRIGILWDTRNERGVRDGYWWIIGTERCGIPVESAEECIEKALPYIEDCLEKIAQYAVPYFKDIAARLGYEYNG